MQAVVDVDAVTKHDTRGGNTRYVLRAADGREFTTFRPAIGERALAAEGRRARIEFHEERRGNFDNVYLDGVEIEEGAPAAQSADSDPEEAAWRTAVDAAPWLLGKDQPVGADELFEELKPFKDRVAEDIRTTD